MLTYMILYYMRDREENLGFMRTRKTVILSCKSSIKGMLSSSIRSHACKQSSPDLLMTLDRCKIAYTWYASHQYFFRLAKGGLRLRSCTFTCWLGRKKTQEKPYVQDSEKISHLLLACIFNKVYKEKYQIKQFSSSKK